MTAPQRVATGLQARYDFNEASGSTIRDTSGVGTPLDLTIGKPTAVSWLSGGLAVNDDAKIESANRATKIIDAVQASNEITVEAWLQPASGSLSAWGADQKLTLADGWLGDYFLLAVYGRALTGAEVQQSYLAGASGN